MHGVVEVFDRSGLELFAVSSASATFAWACAIVSESCRPAALALLNSETSFSNWDKPAGTLRAESKWNRSPLNW
jgi:hypothetical protein